MLDLLEMDLQHGQGSTILDIPVVSLPATSKMNGSLHLRHNLNISSMSASSKHSAASNGFLSSDLKVGSNLIPVTDHAYSCTEIPQELHALQHNKHYPQLKFYCRQHHSTEVLGSLALLSLVSILLAFLAVIFFLQITPLSLTDLSTKSSADKEKGSVYEVVRGLIMCTISLDFSCFLVCAVQFLFAAKLLKFSHGITRASRYLQQGSCSRIFAVCGFFISIPVFLTGAILYAFIQLQIIPAIITAAVLGMGIIFSGIAMIHNVYLWQKEQAKIVTMDKDDQQPHLIIDGLQNASMNTSQVPYMELSTLV